MGQIHQLILEHGIDEAKARTLDKLDRQCVETAFAVMSDEEQRVGMTHAGFACPPGLCLGQGVAD